MMNIAICDDNEKALNTLHKYIDRYFREYTDDFSIKTFTEGTKLLKAHSADNFQVLFLDIDMPEVTGFDVAKVLRDCFSESYIVFVTNHSDLVYKSFDFQPFNFVRKKPVELLGKALKSAVEKLMAKMKQNESLVIEDELSGKVVVYYRDIIYIKSERHYLYYYVKDSGEPIKIRGSITDIEEAFKQYDFARVHRSYIINLRYILNVDTQIGKINLNCETKKQFIPMSRGYKKSVDEAYTMYLRKSL